MCCKRVCCCLKAMLCKQTCTLVSKVKGSGKKNQLCEYSTTCKSEPDWDGIVRVILAVGLICALYHLSNSMSPSSLKEMSKAIGEYESKINGLTNTIQTTSASLRACSKEVEKVKNDLRKMDGNVSTLKKDIEGISSDFDVICLCPLCHMKVRRK